MGNDNQSFTTFDMKNRWYMSLLHVCPQLAWNKIKGTVLCWTKYNNSWPRHLSNLLHTWHQQEMPSSSTSSEQRYQTTSNVTVTSQLWTLILLSATDSICLMVSLNQGFSSSWSPRSYPCILFRSWRPTCTVCFSTFTAVSVVHATETVGIF